MKHTITALALLAAVGSASAFEGDVTLTIKNSPNVFIVHTSTVTEPFIGKNGKTYTTAVQTYVKRSGDTIRRRTWYSCGTDGGEFGMLDSSGKPEGEIKIWVLGGNTVGDDAGLVICHTALTAGEKKAGYSM